MAYDRNMDKGKKGRNQKNKYQRKDQDRKEKDQTGMMDEERKNTFGF